MREAPFKTLPRLQWQYKPYKMRNETPAMHQQRSVRRRRSARKLPLQPMRAAKTINQSWLAKAIAATASLSATDSATKSACLCVSWDAPDEHMRWFCTSHGSRKRNKRAV